MKKVSILWFSKSNTTYKVISLKRLYLYSIISLHILLYISVVSLIGISIYQHVYIAKVKHDLLKSTNEIKRINSLLKEKNLKIVSLKESLNLKAKKISDLQDKLTAVQNEIEEMKQMEIKIRKYLGLEQENVSSDKFSHQGGFEYKKSKNNNLNKTIPSSLSLPTETKMSKNIVDYSKALKESFLQLIDYLGKKQEELRHMPSILPVKGDHFWISCGFGWRINPFTQQREFHSAIDIAGQWKTPIVAPADGIVIKVGKNSILGNYVRIRHTPHITTLYGHLYKAIVKKGDKVKRWDVIGYMGNTGHSTGTHVHYKIEVNGKPVNPIYYIYDQRIKNLALR